MKRLFCLLSVGLAMGALSVNAFAATIYVGGDTQGDIEAFTTNGVESLFALDSIFNPAGIAFDGAGNLYVPDSTDNAISKISTNGVTTIFALDPGDGSVLSSPKGVAFDGAGNLYVANAASDTIEKFTPAGVSSVFAADPGNGSVLSSPSGLAFDHSGNLYVANDASGSSTGPDFIEKFATNGSPTTFATDPGDGSVLNNPVALVFDTIGNLYAANQLGSPSSIEKFTTAAVASRFVSNGLFFPNDLVSDGANNIYVLNQTMFPGTSTVIKYLPNGSGSTVVSNLYNPTALCFDHAGDYCVADYNQIKVFPTNGGNETIFARATVNDAQGLALDAAGNLYVANDFFGDSITKITPGGAAMTYAVTGLPTFGLVFDSAGNLYAAESSANQIVKVATNGSVSIFATDPGTGAVLSYPEGIAMDSGGNLYVVNLNTNNIVKFTPGGTPSTFASTGVNFGYGQGLAIDKANNVYAESESGNSILKFAPNGSSTTFATDPGDNSVLDEPEGMAFDGAGNLYVVNYGSATVEKFTTNGAPSLFAKLAANGGTCITIVPNTFVTIPPPTLFINRAGTNVLLSWAVSSGNFYVQTTPGLRPTNWTTLSNIVPATIGANYVETNTVGAGSKFFRLISQ